MSFASEQDQTIIAQCTPSGTGALALVRISGLNALAVATKISKLSSGATIAQCATHTIQYGAVVNTAGTPIDQVLFLIMHGPRTFTGQDTVEITCHNNPFIIQEIIEQACLHGARIAMPGEFSQRALLNNKIDLIQAEAINELIHANTQMALKQSLQQLRGSLSHWTSMLEQELYKALAYSESSFEFIDEELQFGTQIREIIEQVQHHIAHIKKAFNQQQQIRQGIRIALIGSVNAGKSSLFNSVIGKDRAIVTNIAGTTRDALEAGLYKKGNYWTLIDTAGLRTTNDTIEHMGIMRAHEEAQQADIILLVVDGARVMSNEEHTIYSNLLERYQKKIIVVLNKIDMEEKPTPLKFDAAFVSVSTVTKKNIDVLENYIEEKITALFSTIESPFLLNQRQYGLISELEQKLEVIMQLLAHDSIAYELLSHHLNDALASVSELTGKSVSEKGMDTIFRQFCIGK